MTRLAQISRIPPHHLPSVRKTEVSVCAGCAQRVHHPGTRIEGPNVAVRIVRFGSLCMAIERISGGGSRAQRANGSTDNPAVRSPTSVSRPWAMQPRLAAPTLVVPRSTAPM